MTWSQTHYDDQIGCCRAAKPVLEIKLDLPAQVACFFFARVNDETQTLREGSSEGVRREFGGRYAHRDWSPAAKHANLH